MNFELARFNMIEQQIRPWNMFDEKVKRNYAVSSGWDNAAIIDDSNSIVFSTETYNAAFFEVRDANYKRINDFKSILKSKNKIVSDVVFGFSTFKK